ncbi:MAG: bifunctional diaminohydroxyphosphoribosylaminopyrimidine deaminase/5-amino-6-(5-phosphoribosylamino)uracil reductase RibD, partial [Candidatus Binatus sp.]
MARKATAAPDSAPARDQRFMWQALALAREQLGLTSPNPSVGCVIARDDKVVGRGVTGIGGRPHGEAQALADAGVRARDATAYVSFEPCAHFGQTPPCANALAEAGIKRVVIGCVDPDPRVAGRGIAILKRAKIDLTVGVLEDAALRLNEGFITRVSRGRPLGILKLATSMDG